MGEKAQHQRFGSRLLGKAWWAVAVASVSLLVVVGGAALTAVSFTQDSEAGMASVDHRGWGGEVFDAIHDSVLAQGFIRPANACGLGASSCFRCHNGRRAAEPPADPWHVEHARVNNSCAGCHYGNPRLMREEMSHQGLIAKPLSSPDESCASCHRNAAERQEFLNRYLAVSQP